MGKGGRGRMGTQINKHAKHEPQGLREKEPCGGQKPATRLKATLTAVWLMKLSLCGFEKNVLIGRQK